MLRWRQQQQQRLGRAARQDGRVARQEEKVEEVEAQEKEEIVAEEGERVRVLHGGRPASAHHATASDERPRRSIDDERRALRESSAAAAAAAAASRPLRRRRRVRPVVALQHEVVHPPPAAGQRLYRPHSRTSVREPHPRDDSAGRLRRRRDHVQRQRTLRTSPAGQRRQTCWQGRPQDAQQELHHASERGLSTTSLEVSAVLRMHPDLLPQSNYLYYHHPTFICCPSCVHISTRSKPSDGDWHPR